VEVLRKSWGLTLNFFLLAAGSAPMLSRKGGNLYATTIICVGNLSPAKTQSTSSFHGANLGRPRAALIVSAMVGAAPAPAGCRIRPTQPTR
jgi:hypothetical protein